MKYRERFQVKLMKVSTTCLEYTGSLGNGSDPMSWTDTHTHTCAHTHTHMDIHTHTESSDMGWHLLLLDLCLECI